MPADRAAALVRTRNISRIGKLAQARLPFATFHLLVPSRLHRYRGAMLGLAAGDALGTTLDGEQPGSFTPITDIVGGGPFRMKPGEWTDDTSMALCLAESLVECGEFDPWNQLSRYVKWKRYGHLSSNPWSRRADICGSVAKALARFERYSEAWASPSDSCAVGNGSLMRLAPVALFFARDPQEAVAYAAASSRTTHAHPEAVDACRYLAALIVGALQGRTKAELLRAPFSPIPDLWDMYPLTAAIAHVANGSFLRENPPVIRGDGYAPRCLEAALWAFAKSTCFEDGALLAVNLGEDADTTGAVYGQLAGAHYGVHSIPLTWRKRLAKVDLIERFARRLYDATPAARQMRGGGKPSTSR